jgi:hypothetical protein
MSRTRVVAWAVCGALAATSLSVCLSACVGGSKGGITSEDKDRLKPFILD